MADKKQPNEGERPETPQEKKDRLKAEAKAKYLQEKINKEEDDLIKLLKNEYVCIGDNYYKKIHIGGAKGKEKVPESSNFGAWLKKQPASFQDEYFSKFTQGKKRKEQWHVRKKD